MLMVLIRKNIFLVAAFASAGFRHKYKTASIDREKEFEMVNFFRNIIVTVALLAFAKFVSKDKEVIG